MVRRTVVAFTTFAIVTFGANVAPGFAQTVDEIVAKNYATRGGPEHWKSIQTQTISGTAWGQGTEVGLTIYSKRPNLGRQEITIEIPGQPAITMVNLFDGVKAWASNPMSGSDELQELSGAQADTIRDQSDFDGAFLDYRAKGHAVDLVGTEALGEKRAHHLKVTRKGRPAQHFYIEVETGLELKISTEAGAGPASDVEYSDYRLVSGVQVPHLIRITQNGVLVAELRATKVEFNVPIDDAWFRAR